MKTKKSVFKKNRFLGLSLVLLLVASCTKNEVATTDVAEAKVEATDKNILEFISDRDDATIFEEIIETSSPEVTELLSGDENYTIFVPTDQAWEAFFNHFVGYGSVDDLTIEKRKDLRDLIVKYHTVKGIFLTGDFMEGQEIESVEGQPFTIASTGKIYLEDNTNTTFNDGDDVSTVIEADSTVSNGVVHFIDRVMIPNGLMQTLTRQIIERDDTTIFKEALRKTDLLTYYGDITRADAFVPSDTAWKTCFELLGDNFNSLDDFDTPEELALLKEIMLEHVTKGIGPDGFSALTELNDIDTQLVMRDNLKNNYAFCLKDATGLITQFEELNIPAENKCRLHIIDRVLLPQSVVDYVVKNYKDSLMDFIMKLDDCKSLNEALAAVPVDQLPSFLKNGTPFTLLLPSKEALTAFESQYNTLDTQQGREILANVLGYHFIFGQKIAASDIVFDQPYATFQYEPIRFEQNGNGGINVINSKGNQAATVLSANHDIGGGTVHVIDNVLLPAELDYYKNE